MDIQPVISGQLVEEPISTSLDGQSSICRENNHCCLEHLLSRKDFNYLATVLNAAVWQRFYLLADDHLQANCHPEDRVVLLGKHKQTASATVRLRQPCFLLLWGKENIAGLSGTNVRDTLCGADQSGDFLHTVCTTCHRNTDADNNPCIDDFITPCGDVSSSILLSPWFVLSAVFTGCPKLLHYLLSLCVDYHKDKQITDDTGKERLRDVASAEEGLEAVSTTSQSLKVAQSSKHNNKHFILHANVYPTVPAAVDSKEQAYACPRTVHELVNSKIECEFPFTDTWIRQSINLIVSPLHLACWRHDYCSISLLLQNGADPNELAMEQVPDELIKANCTGEPQDSFLRLNDTLYFYYNKGLSPLHFIALGLRSPPRHSLLDGCKVGIIHDNAAYFQKLRKQSESSEFSDERWTESLLQINQLKDIGFACSLLNPGQCDLEEKYETVAKSELVVACLELLLRAGANPNTGESVILKGAYPLDVILQPPSKVYYAPSAARGNQSSISLRLYDLQHCADQVIVACDTLLCHGAGLSFKFLKTYTWRPELLDCFHLNDTHNCQRLVVFLIRLGLFSDRFSTDGRPDAEAGLCSIGVYTSVVIHRFVADVINTSIPVFLTLLILNWCSVVFLHNISTTVAKIAEMSGWNDSLKQISDMALSLQLRSLKHSCFYVILSRVRYSSSAIKSLPLPTRLKMELTHLYL